MRAIFTFGKHKNEKVNEVPASYLQWLATHKNVLKPSNQIYSDDAKELLERKEEMLQGIRQEVSGEFDMLRSARATAAAATEPFTAEEMFNALVEASNGETVLNLKPRRVQSLLTTLCTQIADFDLIELPDGRYTQYS
ncbi:MAG TPA: hypothetical protein VHV10_16610 [Ktedonobacteraceae bacterium]|jgi:ElaB/YqjD/DUF883 family membrane-anchored ribosome-binding protein|nr:hypothetical protein [Ktedonobacteraceae bacterium]